jgi:sugar phosphate isomerase/epimerase
VHPRLSVSAVSSWHQDFDEDLALWERLGVDQVGLSLRKCESVGVERAARRIRDAGLRVSNVGDCGWCRLDDRAAWRSQQHRLLDAQAVFDVPFVLTTGPAGALDWMGAANAFVDFAQPLRNIAVENTSPSRVDLSFVTTLVDVLELGRLADTGVCVELNSCWMERTVGASLLASRGRVTHVQVSDWKIGSLCTPDRRVPGDGDIPLDRLLRLLVESAYPGAFELELVGPAIEDEGYESSIRRAIARTDELLGEAFADGGDEALH